MNRQTRRTILVFIMLGILATAVGISTLTKHKKYTPVEAQITHVEERYNESSDEFERSVTVKYMVGRQHYEQELGYWEEGYEEGKQITIRYNEADPTQIVEDSIGFAVYLVIIGPILILLAAVLILRGRRLGNR